MTRPVGSLPRRRSPSGLAVHEAGRGSPVVLIHGVGLRLESWRAQVDALAARYRVLAVDQPGHGESPRLASPTVTVADLAAPVAGLIEAECDGPCVVIGHSLGALVAIELAASLGERVAGVAALTPIFERSDEAFATVTARAEWLAGASDDEVAEMPMARWFGGATDPVTQRLADTCRAWLREGDRDGYVAAYRAFAGTRGPARDTVARLGCPALFYTAEHDPNSTPAMSAALARLAPAGECAVLADARHMMQMTHPEAVNRVLAAFIERCIGG